ncbi:MAG: integral membrane protein [Flavobacteriales bacterium]|jgi:integral membrane protein
MTNLNSNCLQLNCTFDRSNIDNMHSELNLLRKAGLIEGISALVLFLVAMPMKYIWGNEGLMSISGNVHGFLFVAYVVMVFVTGRKYSWSIGVYVMCILAAIPPFGAFLIEKGFYKPLSLK